VHVLITIANQRTRSHLAPPLTRLFVGKKERKEAGSCRCERAGALVRGLVLFVFYFLTDGIKDGVRLSRNHAAAARSACLGPVRARSFDERSSNKSVFCLRAMVVLLGVVERRPQQKRW